MLFLTLKMLFLTLKMLFLTLKMLFLTLKMLFLNFKNSRKIVLFRTQHLTSYKIYIKHSYARARVERFFLSFFKLSPSSIQPSTVYDD